MVRSSPPMTERARGRILVVDDEREVREALERILRKEEFDVETAATTKEALDLADRSHFDLVITDLVMPGADGIALLSGLRGAHPDVKVVVVTAFGEWTSYLDAMNAGAIDYVTKPLRKSEIIRLVRRALGIPPNAPLHPGPAGSA